VEPASLQAKAYGIKLYVLFKDAEIGTAFMRRTQVYNLGSRNDRLTVDETYFYCNGFLSADIVRVTEKSWSKYYAPMWGTLRTSPRSQKLFETVSVIRRPSTEWYRMTLPSMLSR
jgi:hypothetical protein